MFSARTENQMIDGTAVSRQRDQHLSGGRVVEGDGIVRAWACQALVIGTPCQRRQVLHSSTETEQLRVARPVKVMPALVSVFGRTFIQVFPRLADVVGQPIAVGQR